MKHHLLAAALAAVAALPAQAALTTDAGAIAGPTILVDFEAFEGLLTSGPVTVAPGVVFTGDSGAELGANVRDLGDNGIWGVGNLFAAGGVAGELRFTFTGGPTSAVGAFVSHYANAVLPFPLVVEVSAYGNNNQIIETHSLQVAAGALDYNAGSFVGISRAQADIRSISFKGLGVVADDLLLTTPVPEPGTWALMLAGLGLVGMLGRRRA
jgi:opacity protein-like surface antigen